MIDRNIEKTLDLLGMQIHGEDTVYPRGDQKICDELSGNWDARLVFAVLAGVTVKGKDGGDAEGTGATGGIDEDEQFHEVLIGGRAGWLDNKKIIASDILFKLHKGLAVGKSRYGGLAQGDLHEIGNPLGELWIGIPGKDLQSLSEDRGHGLFIGFLRGRWKGERVGYSPRILIRTRLAR